MRVFKWLTILSAAFLSIAYAAPPIYGVNIHRGGESPSANGQFAQVMKDRGLKTGRMDLLRGDQTNFLDQVSKIRANGGKVEAVVTTSYHTDFSCNQNLAFVESDSYNQTYSMVNAVKDQVQDFELLNEIGLRQDINREVPHGSAYWDATKYANKPCVATITAAVRGMSRAIDDIKTQSGLPLKKIIGVFDRDYALLTWFGQNGITWDITGIHAYHTLTDPSLSGPDGHHGDGGMIGQAGKFGKPVRLNEFNCGEIYSSSYDNTANGATVVNCYKALVKHLKEARDQTVANLESVHFYELVDHPTWGGAEGRFGLTYNISQPKVHLYIAAAFAGGTLTTAERNELTSRGLLTNAEIDAMAGGNPPPPPPPPSTESGHGTTIPSASQIVDNQGATWTVSSGVIYRNGIATISSNVTLLLYYDHTVYQQNTYGGWWKWDNTITSGNPWIGTSDPRVVTTPDDTSAPSLTITSPSNGASYYRRTTVNFQATASDNVGVNRVEFYLNGALYCTDYSSAYSCSIRLPGSRRTNTLTVRAFDAAGNKTEKYLTVYTR